MAQKIAVIGTGYVGLIVAVGLADFGNIVTGVDQDERKITMLNQGKCPIYEPGVEEYLKRNLESKRLQFTSDTASAIQDAEVIFIAVGTPAGRDGEPDLSYVENVVSIIGENLNDYKVIVTKSTVPIGTNRRIYRTLKEKDCKAEFDVVSNPEFLREGHAIEDFFHPDRVVIGYENEKARDVLFSVYSSLYLISVPFIWCNIETAELIKYASNSFLATNITYINEIANLSELIGADVHLVAKAMGMDGRISPKFLHPGPGYGGSCFPKDTKAIVIFARKHDIKMNIIKTVIETNEKQKLFMVEKLKKHFGSLKSKTVAVLGLAFKQYTDDIRESPALIIIDEIIKKGGNVRAHDPKGMKNFSGVFPDITYCNSAYDAAEGADALMILTEWNEYRGIDLQRLKKIMNGKFVLDTRNILDPDTVRDNGFFYSSVGRK